MEHCLPETTHGLVDDGGANTEKNGTSAPRGPYPWAFLARPTVYNADCELEYGGTLDEEDDHGHDTCMCGSHALDTRGRRRAGGIIYGDGGDERLDGHAQHARDPGRQQVHLGGTSARARESARTGWTGGSVGRVDGPL